MKLAALLQFTLPGPPVIYYGTEVGVSQWHDLQYPDGSRRPEESRTPMHWGEEQDMEVLAFYRRLIAWRRANVTRLGGERSLREATPEGGYVSMIGSDLLLAINRAGAPLDVSVPADASLALTTGERVRLASGTLMLPPNTGAILE